jgi:hypothetical protein
MIPAQIFHETHRQRAYDKDEIVLWLQEAGFTEVAVYDSYSLKPAKKYSDRLFYVAVKKARPEA